MNVNEYAKKNTDSHKYSTNHHGPSELFAPTLNGGPRGLLPSSPAQLVQLPVAMYSPIHCVGQDEQKLKKNLDENHHVGENK